MIFQCMELFHDFSRFSMISRVCGNPGILTIGLRRSSFKFLSIKNPNFDFNFNDVMKKVEGASPFM